MSAFRFVRRARRSVTRPSLVSVQAPRLMFERLEDRVTPASFADPLFATGILPTPGGGTNLNGAPLKIAVADINGDGRDDFVGAPATNSGTPRINVYLSTGKTGSTYTATSVNNFGALGNPVALALADVTADGKAEIITGSTETGDVRVFRLENTGAIITLASKGTDFDTASPPAPNLSIGGVAGGDFNGDGLGDIIVPYTASKNGTQYSILLNAGNGKSFIEFRNPLSTGGGVGGYTKPVVADFDQDGNLDFAMLQAGSNRAFVMFGDGAGSFSFARSLSVTGTPTSLAVGDFDGNGKPDLAVGLSNGSVTLFLKDATSTTFTTRTKAASLNAPIVDLTAGDFDLDLLDDLAIVTSDGNFPATNGGTQNVDVFVSSPTVATTGLTPAAGTPYGPLVGIGGSVATIDLDNNGNLDFVVGEGTASNQRYTPFINQSFVGGETFLVQDKSTIEFGETVTYQVTVVPPPQGGSLPTGTVQFFEVTTDTGGSQTFTFLASADLAPGLDSRGSSVAVTSYANSTFGVGIHTVVGKYLGDSNYGPVSSNTQAVTVTQATTQTTVTTPTTTPSFGQAVVLTATVETMAGVIPTGDVVFFDNGNQLGSGSIDASGKATITVPQLDIGIHSIQARYLGATSFLSSISNGLTINVTRSNTTTSIGIDKTSAVFGDAVTLFAQVAIAPPGVGIPTGSVEFYEGNTKIAIAGLNSATGQASTVVNGLTVGDHTFTAKYTGNSNVAGSTSGTVTVNITPTISVAGLTISSNTNQIGLPVTLTAFVNDTQTPPRPVTVGTVTFTGTDGTGAPLTFQNVTVVNGQAQVTIPSLPLGTATFQAKFSGTESIAGSQTNTVSVVSNRATPVITITNSANASTVILGKDVTFTANLAPAPGLTAPVTGSVTFLDNGTPLASLPIVNGQVSVTARLDLGLRNISVVYSGDGTYNQTTATTAITISRPIDPIVVGAGVGGSDIVRVFNTDGTLRSSPLFAFGPDHTSGARVASGDVNGDGVPDLLIGSGPGTQARIRVLDGATSRPLFETFPFESFTGGVFVAMGDINGDLIADLIVSPDQGGGPRVTIFSGNNSQVMANFFAIDDVNFRGGARPAVGDINGDGATDLIVAAGFGGGPRVAAFDGRSLRINAPVKLFNDFFAFEQTLRNGVYVAAGDVDGDGFGDIVVGGGPGGGPRIISISGRDLLRTNGTLQTLNANFFAGNPADRSGVPVSVLNLDGDNRADIAAGSGSGGRTVNVYFGSTLTATGQPAPSRSFDTGFDALGGVFVG